MKNTVLNHVNLIESPYRIEDLKGKDLYCSITDGLLPEVLGSQLVIYKEWEEYEADGEVFKMLVLTVNPLTVEKWITNIAPVAFAIWDEEGNELFFNITDGEIPEYLKSKLVKDVAVEVQDIGNKSYCTNVLKLAGE